VNQTKVRESKREVNMSLKATPLETKIREALKEHQHEGLHMIGGVDQLVGRILSAVEQWLDEERTSRKSA
jgi:hypothetical protein